MDIQLFILCALTFVIHLIGTLAYAVRIAGVRTRRIAVCFALFNILVLVSRTSNSFQGPFLAKRIEENIVQGVSQSLLSDFRWLLLSATLATLIGAFLIPTFQRIFSLAVRHFQTHRSLPRLLMHGFFKGGIGYVRESVRLPSSENVTSLRRSRSLSIWVLVSNTLAVALWTIGVFAALYAGALNPELRVTASTLSSVINGVATILMFAFIDPHLSVMTDDVIEGQVTESSFRQAIVWLVGSRLAGTVLGQALLVPSAMAIAAIAAAM